MEEMLFGLATIVICVVILYIGGYAYDLLIKRRKSDPIDSVLTGYALFFMTFIIFGVLVFSYLIGTEIIKLV